MKYERITPFDVNIEDVLTELLEYMEDRQDADHDGESFVANNEMKLATDIRQLLWQMEKEKPENKVREKDWATGMPFGRVKL